MERSLIAKSGQSELAQSLAQAMQSRMLALGLNAETLGAAIGRDASTIRAHMRGGNKPFFSDMLALDDYFAALGQSGLIDELRGRRPAPAWGAENLVLKPAVLPPPARQLLALQGALRDAGRSYQRILRERGLDRHVHVLATADGAIRPIYFGDAMPSKIDPSVVGRDVRGLADAAYGRFIHGHGHERLLGQGAAVHRITSPGLSYYRASVPVAGLFLISFTWAVDAPKAFVLR